MKTADLIPFILLELDESDKYGFELTKNIETKSGGKIIIKQPTLYTLLKKLEKSKFIASYWQDSEIGGKRHYYKLTENGRAQVSTLPSYNALLKNVLDEDFEQDEVPVSQDKPISIMDELLNQNTTPLETILPTNEVFSSENIDEKTELDLNLNNTEILKEENVVLDEKFASNNDVQTFTEKIVPISAIKTPELNLSSNDILDKAYTISNCTDEIKHVDYENFSNNENNKFAKKLVKKRMLQILATSGCLLIILSLCELITTLSGHSTLYYLFFISALLIAIFYPVIYLSNIEKYRLKYQANAYKPKFKQKIFIGLTILLTIIIIGIVVSIALKKNSITLMLSFNNFANIYAPTLIFSTYFIDILLQYLLTKRINN